jgi:hypothetical protein
MVILLNIHLIKEYIRKMTLEDIKKFAYNKEISLSDEEAKNIYDYIKNNYNNFFNGKISINDIINEASVILSSNNFKKFMNIYLQYKDRI